MDDARKDPRDYVDLLRRRWLAMLLPALGLAAVSAAVAFALPPAYRSTATILIEEQDVPPDMVRSTVTSYADQRIQTIKQQVMSRTNLLRIIERYDLYAGMRQRDPIEEVLARMADDIAVEVISAEVVDPRTGRQTEATIAFTLAYDGATPQSAQRVTNELVSLFLAENLESRQRKAKETTAFLEKESESLESHIEEVERRIAAFKRRSQGALPELLQFNIQLMDRTDRDLSDTEQQIRALEDRKIYLEGVLATLKPNTPIVAADGQRILDAPERLKTLRTQLIGLGAYLAPEHPDVIRVRREIDALEREVGRSGSAAEIEKRLVDERATLASLLERYAPDHPDVLRARKVVAALEAGVVEAASLPAAAPSPPPENPGYITIQAQIASTENDLQVARERRSRLRDRVEQYRQLVERTPAVEREYVDLTRDRDNTLLKYREIRGKLLEAQVSEGLEADRKGERFSLIDPPLLPQRPVRPNRPAIMLLGALVAMAGGVGAGAVAEQLDRAVHGPVVLARLTAVPTLAVIPRIENGADRSRRRRRLTLTAAAVLAGFVLVPALVHVLVMPLDVLWFVVLRRLGAVAVLP